MQQSNLERIKMKRVTEQIQGNKKPLDKRKKQEYEKEYKKKQCIFNF